jgi:hypothetical protein
VGGGGLVWRMEIDRCLRWMTAVVRSLSLPCLQQGSANRLDSRQDDFLILLRPSLIEVIDAVVRSVGCTLFGANS